MIHQNERAAIRTVIQTALIPFAHGKDERDHLLNREAGAGHDFPEEIIGVAQALALDDSRKTSPRIRNALGRNDAQNPAKTGHGGTFASQSHACEEPFQTPRRGASMGSGNPVDLVTATGAGQDPHSLLIESRPRADGIQTRFVAQQTQREIDRAQVATEVVIGYAHEGVSPVKSPLASRPTTTPWYRLSVILESVYADPHSYGGFTLAARPLMTEHVRIDLHQESHPPRAQPIIKGRPRAHREVGILGEEFESPRDTPPGPVIVFQRAQESLQTAQLSKMVGAPCTAKRECAVLRYISGSHTT
jgi:hypothetical protein